MELQLGYWNIRGLAAPLRMICEYAGVPYQDNQYDSFEGWFAKGKPALQELNPLINLPYVRDGDVLVTQSNACLQYLGTKLGLDPKDPLSKEYLSNNQILNEIFDLRNNLVALSYAFANATRSKEEFEARRPTHLDQVVPKSYAKLEAHLAKAGTPYFSGAGPMSGDFHVWEMLDQHEALAKSCGHGSLLESYPKLKAFYDAFRALPQLAKYFESPAYRLPINNPLGNAFFQ